MKVLITGANGFSGKNLRQLLEKQANQLELYYTDIKKISGNDKNFIATDLTKISEVTELIGQIRPRQIYHLAGIFSNKYELDYAINVQATQNILESVLAQKLSCRVLLIGSAAEYGVVKSTENPLKEKHYLNPSSIYGLTKVYQTKLMHFYHNRYNMDLVMARTFNLKGKGQSPRLFTGRLDQQIQNYLKDNQQLISIGNLEAKRDYIDIEKAVYNYQLIMEKGVSGEVYNVGSGYSINMKALLMEMLQSENLDLSIVKQEPEKFVSPLKDIYADITKLNQLKQL